MTPPETDTLAIACSPPVDLSLLGFVGGKTAVGRSAKTMSSHDSPGQSAGKKSPSTEGLFQCCGLKRQHQVIWMMVCMMVLWVEMVLAFA